ncbi:MAG: serine/threonine protein kinase [Phycisphaerae bacterium]|nr:serine/threonine protein kinase [Phycisphaerae bacterium]
MGLEQAESSTVERSIKRAPSWLGKKVGRFKLLALLGQGAMGRVFRAEDTQLQRQVALKVLPLQVKSGDKTIKVEQFIREARSAAVLEHPGVMQIYEINQAGDVFYIAMELLEGKNLLQLVKASGPMDIVRACQMGAEAAEALGHAHERGVIHRDIKPSNLMLSRGGRCKISDFGLARIDDPNDSFFLGTEAVGTPLYMAPEIPDNQPATFATDIYSLAATMFFLLSGRPPYQGQTIREILKQHASAPIPDLRELRPEIPERLAQAITKGLAKSPADRFASAEEFANILRVHTIPIGDPRNSGVWPAMLGNGSGQLPVPTPPAANRTRVIIAVAAALLLLIGGVAAYIALVPSAPSSAMAAAPHPTDASAEIAANKTSAAIPAADTTAAGDGSTFTPAQYDALMSIASDTKNPLSGKMVTVVGTPNKSHITSSGNLRLTFEGADEDHGFQVFCPTSVLKDMETRFGGNEGVGIVGHPIIAQGIVSLFKGRPEIRLDSASQLSLAK